MLLFPLIKLTRIKKINVSTYQAVSGAGKNGIQELERQINEYHENSPITVSTFKSQIFGNCFSHNTKIDPETRYNDEELKIIQETKKILNNQDIKISATCIRVPVFRVHTQTVSIKFEDKITYSQIVDILQNTNGVKIIDDIENNQFPEPIIATNKTDIFVGRIREDINNSGKLWHFMICGDQLLKGASYNAYQIYEKIIK
jgi:aspartate-semialdehyde dehydrogenase